MGQAECPLLAMVSQCKNAEAPAGGASAGAAFSRRQAGSRSTLADEHRLANARALDGEAHFAVDQCEQRVILADADVRAGVELGAALADDDGAGRHGLAAEHLHAEHLRLRIAAVSSRAAALLLCHFLELLSCC